MILSHQRYVRVRMIDRREDFVSRCRVSIQFTRVLRIDVVRRVDDVAIDDQLADVVQVTGDLNSLDFLFTPTHLTRDDLTVLTNAFRVTLRVLVLDVDRRRESPDGIAIDRAQLFVQSSILFCALRYLFEQTMRVNPDADVPHHRTNRFEIFFRKLVTTRLAAEQDPARCFSTHTHRQHELNAFTCELVTMSVDEAVRSV